MTDNNMTDNLTGLFDSPKENSPFVDIFGQNNSQTISEIMVGNSVTNNNTIIKYIDMIENKFTPYPNSDEIPVLKIKNEDFLVRGERIESLIHENFPDDDRFNRCKNCGEKKNKFFCKNCEKNICENCSKNCQKDRHKLDKLGDLKIEVDIKKRQIKEFLSKLRKDSGENSQLPWDIALITYIVEKDYNNYFHFQNINESHSYLYTYEEVYNNAFLKIIYAVNEENNLKEKERDYKIFGQTFVEKNKDKIYLKINGEKSDLIEKVKIKNNNKPLEVILIKKPESDISDISYMFCNCKSNVIKLIEIKNRTKVFLKNVTNISKMFKNCSNLENIDLFFFKAFEELRVIDSLFSGCEKLNKITKIEELVTKSVTKMDKVFNLCKKLNNVSGIEKFETKNVESFDEMFKDCSSLKEFPDISRWNLEKAKSLKGIFEGCSSLENLPNIGLWNVGNVISFEEMFEGCSNLMELPKGIVHWNVKNVKNMKKMFSGCMMLGIGNLPDLKNWNLENLETMDKMFFGCRTIIIREKATIENLFTFKNIEIISYDNVLG